MPNLNAVLRQLESERSAVLGQIKQLDSALQVLEGLDGVGRGRGRRGGPRHMSAAARKRIADAQKARWAKWKAVHKKK
jgi:hypothetical protein